MVGATVHNGCLECQTLWEAFDIAALIDGEDPNSSFKSMCENYAFRPGSPSTVPLTPSRSQHQNPWQENTPGTGQCRW